MLQPALQPNFLEVSPFPTKGALKVVPDTLFWKRTESPLVWAAGRDKIIMSPQLFGELLVLGVNKKIDPQTARSILELLRADLPRFYRLRDFVLREVPEGSSEGTTRIRIWKFWVDLYELIDSENANDHHVRLYDGGHAECSCWEFRYELAGTKGWCRHIKALHQFLREFLFPNVERFPYHLPLLEVEEVSEVARFIESLGGLYEVLLREEVSAENYSHIWKKYKDPMLGVELEIPGTGEELSFLKKVLTLLKGNGLILSYERDASVYGGEIKLKPFPATIEECLEKGKLLKTLRDLGKGLFEDELLAGLHVHINMWPYNCFSRGWIMEKLYPIVHLFEKRFNLAVLFGRGFNRYARRRKRARGKAARYGWINYEPLPYTVEVRLGCAKKGDPVKILLVALLLQRAFWARLEGTFRVPSVNASREKIISAFADLLSEEERRCILPLLEEALIDGPQKRD